MKLRSNYRGLASLVMALAISGLSPVARALPTLQLDASGGNYVGGSEESVVISSDTFDLYALLNEENGGNADSTLSGLYRVAIALTPKAPLSPVPNIGSFSFAGETYTSADMTWGIPPDALLTGTTSIGAELASHGVYDTYFMEFDFMFNSANQLAPYNVQDDSGNPASHIGTGLYFEKFAVDVSALGPFYGLHFDLYQVAKEATKIVSDTYSPGAVKKKIQGQWKWVTYSYSTDMIEFAPFSHDAEYVPPPPQIPDSGTTAIFLGASLIVAGLLRRKTT